MKYTMSIANGRIPSITDLEDLYTKKDMQYTTFIFDRKAKNLPIHPDTNIRWVNGVNTTIKNEYHWYYDVGWL